MPITVSGLALAPVKGMRLCCVPELELDGRGVVGDRTFLVVDAEHKLLTTSRNPKLMPVRPEWDGETLRLRFPDGAVAEEAPEPGAKAVTQLYDGRELPGRLVNGALAEALSDYLGRSVALLQRDADQFATDDFPVSLMSEASLRALAPAIGDDVPDGRRFRMNVRIDGVEAWEEHGWTGRSITVGEAVLRVDDPVPRCVITTRDPDSGRRDAPVLKALAQLRGKDDVTFGVWCEVARPGRIRRGDPISVA